MPISIKIVKEQRSALNPSKISGLCGRLMCCMSYEKEFYSELWAKLPGPGAKIRTEQGHYVLESLDIGHEHVNVRFPSGRLVPVLISEFPDFRDTVLRGEEWGEDKEMAAKKKAMQERVAMLERRKERERLRANARAAKSRNERITKAESAKPKPKALKQNSSGNYQKRRKNKRPPRPEL